MTALIVRYKLKHSGGMTISGVGVRAGVYGGASGGVVLPPPTPRDKDEHRCDDCDHQHEACDGDADSEAARRQAELVGVAHFFALDVSGGILGLRGRKLLLLVHEDAGEHLEGEVLSHFHRCHLPLAIKGHVSPASGVDSARAHRGHISTAVQVLDAQTDVARVVHRGGVGELVRLEARDGRGFAGTVLEPVQDLGVRGATLLVDEKLLPPAQAIPNGTVVDQHAVDVLSVQRDDHGERVPDPDVLRH